VTDFTKAAATALKLIVANGRSVSLIHENTTADDPAKPWEGVSAPPSAPSGGVTTIATVAFVPATGSGLGRLTASQQGTLSVAFDQMGLVAASEIPGVNLEGYSRVIDSDGTSWRIVLVAKLQPAATAVLWTLGLKR
tara:strand:- start:23869 stop:24279 length:411 start_codon:yes stop_codon:yes gene_type:complete